MRIVPITKDGRELVVRFDPEYDGAEGQEISYYDLGDASGAFRNWEFQGPLCQQHPNETIVSFRIEYESDEEPFETGSLED